MIAPSINRSFVAAIALVALAVPAFAQVKAVSPYYAVVTQNSTNLRAGGSERFYSVLALTQGQVVVVDGEGEGWNRVVYPPSMSAFLRAEDAALEGTSVKLTKESRLRAASAIQGWSGSWQPLLESALPAGNTLTLVEPVKEGEVVVGFKVQAPAEARGFVAASRLRRATQAEVDDAKTKGQALPELPNVTISVGPAPATGTGLVIKGADPFANQQGTTTTSATATNASTTTSNVIDISATGEQTAAGTSTAVQPFAGGTATATTTTPTVAASSLIGEDLEPIFRKVWAEPVMSSEIDELISQYQAAIDRIGESNPRRKAGLEQRLNALNIRREFRETMRRQEAELAALNTQKTELQQALDTWAASRVYTIVGVLQPSTVYDGERLPQMYRVVSVGGTSPRTLGYVRRSSELDLDRYIGSVVGVIGEAQLDRSLMLNLINPVRVDPLRSADNLGIVPGLNTSGTTTNTTTTTSAPTQVAPAQPTNPASATPAQPESTPGTGDPTGEK
jgi:hypothetical protein